MKEFKEDKLKLQDEIQTLIKKFNDKYDVVVDDIYLSYVSINNVLIGVDIKVKL